MIFPLRRYFVPNPVPSLGGARIRYKPVLSLAVTGPSGTDCPSALVDSGADDVVLPADIAAAIGIDLTAVPQLQAQGVGGQQATLAYAPIILELSDGTETCRWRAVVAFTTAQLRVALLGIAGGLEHFRTTLDVGRKEVELEAQPSLPRTHDPIP